MRLRKQKSRKDQVTDLAIDYLKLKAAGKAAKGAGTAVKGVASIEGTENLFLAIGHAFAYRDYRALPALSPPTGPGDNVVARWRKRLATDVELDEAESLTLIADFGIQSPGFTIANTPEEAMAAAQAAGDKAKTAAIYGVQPGAVPVPGTPPVPRPVGPQSSLGDPSTDPVQSPMAGDVPTDTVYAENAYNPLDQASDLRDQRAAYADQLDADPAAKMQAATLMSAEEGGGAGGRGAGSDRGWFHARGWHCGAQGGTVDDAVGEGVCGSRRNRGGRRYCDGDSLLTRTGEDVGRRRWGDRRRRDLAGLDRSSWEEDWGHRFRGQSGCDASIANH